jgi:D-arginine dehydrogenase
MKEGDVVVIGAGIAGASVGGALATDRKVVILEREEQPAYHSTGRSAAYYAPGYGNEPVRELTIVGDAFYRSPSAGFSEAPLFRPRDWIHIAREDQLGSLAETQKSLGKAIEPMSCQEVEARVPILRPGYCAAGLIDRRGGDLDVDAILQGFLRQLRRAGGEFVCGASVEKLERRGDRWHLETTAGVFAAPIVVNAAGAWADEVAKRANLAPLGLVPKRRTAILVPGPQGMEITDWPLVVDIDEQFYFKPDAGQILISPADETPCDPCDAQPDEMDVAIAAHRFEEATTMTVGRVAHKWAGLRVFAPDKTPIAGFDPRAPGFFWLAGQGGYGVQTAPGLSQFAASLILRRNPLGPYTNLSSLEAVLSPARFVQ